jgi:cytochrome c553
MLIFTLPPALSAADSNEGQKKSSTCIACHGQQGISPNDQWPNLAGQKKSYILNQLKAFKDGARVNAMMNPLANSLSDQDMQDLADYFSQLKGP